jgi:hypothetical protein
LAQRLPGRGRDLVEDTLRVDLYGHFSREQIRRLERHYAYWRGKWGWDFNNPDMAEVERRWGDTELCWATHPERRAAGEEIVRAFEACSARP